MVTELTQYRVGYPYLFGRGNWPEGCDYNYRQGIHELRMFLDGHRTKKTKNDIRRGPCEFALVERGPLIFLLYQFGESIPWSDATYTIHRVPGAQRTLPPNLESWQSAILTVMLINAWTGVLEVMRAVSFSPEFSRHLHTAIQLQAARPFSQEACDAVIAETYRRYPNSCDLLEIAIARTQGNE